MKFSENGFDNYIAYKYNVNNYMFIKNTYTSEAVFVKR